MTTSPLHVSTRARAKEVEQVRVESNVQRAEHVNPWSHACLPLAVPTRHDRKRMHERMHICAGLRINMAESRITCSMSGRCFVMSARNPTRALSAGQEATGAVCESHSLLV
jgi:hypothetical protein